MRRFLEYRIIITEMGCDYRCPIYGYEIAYDKYIAIYFLIYFLKGKFEVFRFTQIVSKCHIFYFFLKKTNVLYLYGSVIREHGTKNK